MDIISVGLDLQSAGLHSHFEALIASHRDLRLKRPDDPKPPQLLILELDDAPEKTFSLVHSILGAFPATEVFLTSARTEPQVLLEALRAGVKEFLPQPLGEAEFDAALERLRSRLQDRRPQPQRAGKIITLIGCKGGIGTTTIAINLAVCLGESQTKRSVLLVDLDTHSGDVALFLDVAPSHTVADAANNIARLDATFLMTVLSKHASGIYLLPASTSIEDAANLSADAALKTLELLQTLFDYIIVDVGHFIDEITASTLHKSSIILITTTATVQSIRSAKNYLDFFSKIHIPLDMVKIILNRYNKIYDIPIKDIESTLNQKVFWTIANDYQNTYEAIVKAKPLSMVASRSAVFKSLVELALALGSDDQTKKRQFSLKHIFKPF